MTVQESSTIPAAEIARRIEEYRRSALEHRLPAQVIYQGDARFCPWPNCDERIDGIVFQFDIWCSAEKAASLIQAWWETGVVDPCPKCGRLVLFSLLDKRAVEHSTGNQELLSGDWFTKAHLVRRPSAAA
jgi:hypothetical protein